jgi:5-methylcytosine-specific restriction endonuclease McrBC regulatory subunit McrC
LVFVQKYLALFPNYSKYVADIVNYFYPAFQNVDENINLSELKKIKYNSFFKEYKETLHIASLILKRFGYNIKEIDKQYNKVKVPPFWIDMSKLFELYVLGLLKEKYHNQIKYQIQGIYGQPDFILLSFDKRMIIDAKYKIKYHVDFDKLRKNDRDNLAKDIRQLSGYARVTKILKKLGCKTEDEQNTVIDCLIIYPNPDLSTSEVLSDNLKSNPIKGFLKFYKMEVRLPQIQ